MEEKKKEVKTCSNEVVPINSLTKNWLSIVLFTLSNQKRIVGITVNVHYIERWVVGTTARQVQILCGTKRTETGKGRDEETHSCNASNIRICMFT